jgi:hypothetical protein
MPDTEFQQDRRMCVEIRINIKMCREVKRGFKFYPFHETHNDAVNFFWVCGVTYVAHIEHKYRKHGDSAFLDAVWLSML